MATLTLTIHKVTPVNADTDESAFTAIIRALGRARLSAPSAHWAGLGTLVSTLTLESITAPRESITDVVTEALLPFNYYPAL